MSELKVDTINNVDVQDLDKITARAWVNFNGTGVVVVRGQKNVASITDLGVGQYLVNLSVTMSDLNFSVVMTKQNVASNTSTAIYEIQGSRTVTSISVLTIENAAQTDTTACNVVVFGN